MRLKILDEFSPLTCVVLGTAESFGGIPDDAHINDPKSRLHITNGNFPVESDLVREMKSVHEVLTSYDVKVLRPNIIEDYNQIFARDVGVVIEDRLVVPVIAHSRRNEVAGIQHIIDRCDPGRVLRPQEHQRMEGGDIMPWNGKLFVGYSKEADFNEFITARTNEAGVEYLQKTFTDWEIHPFELKKSDEDPYENALHLDCCFQTLGNNCAIIYPGGFKNADDVSYLRSLFDAEKLIEISRQEMYEMNSNVFSISPEVILSEERFVRLNQQLRSLGFTVEEVPFHETSKMEGLLRCATLPLSRYYE